MIDDVVAGFFKGVARFLGYILLEIILELLLNGPGYFISKQFTKHDPDSDGVIVVFTGFMFWIVLDLSAYGIYSYISVDSSV